MLRLTDHGVDKIEENARGLNRHQPYPLARPTDTLLLVSLVRELKTENAQLSEKVKHLEGLLDDEGTAWRSVKASGSNGE